jgi:hypothetical protein
MYIHHCDVTQTLTMLDLYGNEIGDEGARYLATTLEINTVSQVFY